MALDSNVLIYALGLQDEARSLAARAAIASVAQHDVVVPAQVLGEVFAVLTRKFQFSAARARTALQPWRDICSVVATTEQAIVRAVDLAVDHRLGIWDAVIFAASAEAGCRLLLSEDMQDGFVWGGVQVVNPCGAGGLARLQGLV